MLKTAAALTLIPAGGSSLAAAGLQAQTPPAVLPNPFGKRGIGAAFFGFGQRMRANRSATPPVDWIDYCHSLGLGGVEAQQPPTDSAEVAGVRKRIESYNMRLMFEFNPPRTAADLPRFEAQAKAASECGAYALHGGLTPRRYEQFSSVEEFKTSFASLKAQVALAEPILRKYKIPASIENHKGWRAEEQAAWFKQVSSEYIRIHFDFGNNVSLCEDPMQTLDILLPYVMACHIKDMAVAPYDEGFLLSEVPLGDGFLNLKAMVQKLRAKDPNMGFDLEMATRDPLKIPVFTDKYWVTFTDPSSPLPGKDLAHILTIVKNNPPRKPLPKTTGLSPVEQLALEDLNNRLCVDWARKNLEM